MPVCPQSITTPRTNETDRQWNPLYLQFPSDMFNVNLSYRRVFIGIHL